MKKPFQPVIGIIGGGQLGKMLIESALPWNVQYNVLDPDNEAPCKKYAGTFINASLKDDASIRQLAAISDVLTYEIEHVNTNTLLDLEAAGKVIIPSPRILQIIQDKSLQKQFYTDNQLPTANFYKVETPEQWLSAIQNLPGDKIVAKLCKEGYDGKGVSICSKTEIQNGKFPFEGPCIIEEFIQGCREMAVIVAGNGATFKTWPVIEMDFDPALNLVDYLFSPANLETSIADEMCNIAINAIKALDGKGVFAVEFFLTPDNQILINEIAPRPHNSGHHTIEAAHTSQYEQLNRILLDLPLGDTSLFQSAVMVNIIGPAETKGDYRLDGLDTAFATPGFYLHLYKKNETRPGRKMGHFTVLADTVEKAVERAMIIKKQLKIVEL